MKFIVEKKTGENVANLMRQSRYRYTGQSKGQMSFVRPLGQNPYPRFHIYLTEYPPSSASGGLRRASKVARKISLTLHLDQKQPSYKGTAAHSGEYAGKLLDEEAERIKQIFEQL